MIREANIINILDYMDSCEYLSVADLCRWCALNGLYSVFRRAGNIVLRALAEHNRVHYHDSPEYYLSKRVEILEKQSEELIRSIERQYGTFWERQNNPFREDTVQVNMQIIKEMLREGKNPSRRI